MAALENITVTVYRKEGTGDDITYSFVRSTKTIADGTYELKGLSAGTYALRFQDSDGNYLTEYYDGKATLDLSTAIVVGSATSVTGKNAVLGAASSIAGTVTDA